MGNIVDKLLKAFKENVGKWTCSYCNSGSNQPAATFREIKKMGYVDYFLIVEDFVNYAKSVYLNQK